jgi:hypothetical protein
MSKNFKDNEELLDQIFPIIRYRKDLLPIVHNIRHALKEDTKRWTFDVCYYTGIVFPIYEGKENYTFQIVGESFKLTTYYYNITVYRDYLEKYICDNVDEFLGSFE